MRGPVAAGPARARALPAATGRHGGGIAAVGLGGRVRVSDPSLRVAIALARALGRTVEELFGAEDPVAPVAAAPVAPPGGTGARVTLAAMADGYVALPLRGVTASRGGILPAGGLIAGDGHDPGQVSRTVRPIGPPRPTLLAAGCDPALPLLAAPLGLLDPPVGFTWWPCRSVPRPAVRRDAPRRPNLRESRPTPTHHPPSPAAVPRRCPVRTTHALPRSMHSGGHHGRPTSRWRLTAAAMACRSS